jgi:hypothetical protein
MYELTFNLATLEPLPPEFQRILGRRRRQRERHERVRQLFAGVLPVPEFFSSGHVDRIMQAASA